MNAAAALIAVALSGAILLVLAHADPKRRRTHGLPPILGHRLARAALIVSALAPGMFLALNANPAGFLIWSGATPMIGWFSAAWLAHVDPGARPEDAARRQHRAP